MNYQELADACLEAHSFFRTAANPSFKDEQVMAESMAKIKIGHVNAMLSGVPIEACAVQITDTRCKCGERHVAKNEQEIL